MEKIVLFDGYCILCDWLVDFLLRVDKKNKLKFASLQSELASSILVNLEKEGKADPDTVVFFDNGRIYSKSAAILKIFSGLPQPYPLLTVFWVIPAPLRDGIYSLISQNRVRWFGRRDNCRVPDEETEGRIL